MQRQVKIATVSYLIVAEPEKELKAEVQLTSRKIPPRIEVMNKLSKQNNYEEVMIKDMEVKSYLYTMTDETFFELSEKICLDDEEELNDNEEGEDD